jgi:Zn-dependent protease with chaperone function
MGVALRSLAKSEEVRGYNLGESADTRAMAMRSDGGACRARRCLRWGVTYRGTVEVAAAVAAVVDTLAELGLEARTEEVSGGAVAIRAKDGRSLYRRLSAKRPNRLSGWVEPIPNPDGSDDAVRFCLDLTLASDYRAVVAALWLYWILGLVFLFRATSPGSGWSGPGAAIALAVGFMGVLLLVACDAFLLRVLGGGRMSQVLWEPILRRVEAAGGVVEPEGTGIGRRYLSWFGGYGLSLFLWVTVLVASTDLESGSRMPWPVSGLLLGLFAVVVVLLGTAAVMAVWRGFAVRAGAVVLGLGGPLAMVFLLALPLPLLLTIEETSTMLLPVGDRLAGWSRLLLVASGLIGVTGAFLVGTLVRSFAAGRSQLQRTHRHREFKGVYWEGVRGGRLLVILRALFVACALGLGAMVLTGLSFALFWAVQAVVPAWSGGQLGMPEMTGPLLAAALGFPLDDPWAGAVARSVWVLWAGAAWGLFGISVGQLVRERRRLRRDLLKHLTDSSEDGRVLVDRMERLLRRADRRLPRVDLSISPDRAVAAHALRFARPRREWFVMVSAGALERLTPEELEALLAHELSHLARGHLLRHDLARWLGRIAQRQLELCTDDNYFCAV